MGSPMVLHRPCAAAAAVAILPWLAVCPHLDSNGFIKRRGGLQVDQQSAAMGCDQYFAQSTCVYCQCHYRHALGLKM